VFKLNKIIKFVALFQLLDFKGRHHLVEVFRVCGLKISEVTHTFDSPHKLDQGMRGYIFDGLVVAEDEKRLCRTGERAFVNHIS
jgi:hypothetical protein